MTSQGLRISEEQFNELYPDLKGDYSFFNEPPPEGISTEEFERAYLKSKLWRLNNIYTVIGKDGKPTIFKMNYAQHVTYAASRHHPRIIILKSRQQGISTLWLVSYFDDAIFCPFLNIGLMAQGTDEASTLLERTKFLWDRLSADVKNFLNIRMLKDNSKEVTFSNKSTIFIRVSFRSATLQRLHVSEYGKIANAYPKRAKETKTGTLQALAQGNTGAIESTAEGHNEFKSMWDTANIALHSGQMSAKDFFPVFLSWVNDPDCRLSVHQTVDDEAASYFKRIEEELKIRLTPEQKNFWIAQHRELDGDIYQEYPATPEEAFTAARNGTYYSRAFNEKVVRMGKVKPKLYDPNLPIDVHFDLGVDDYCVAAATQWYKGAYRIVDEYWNNGYDLSHYIQEMCDRGYRVRYWKLPHDGGHRQVAGANDGGKAKTVDKHAKDFIRSRNLPGSVLITKKTGILDGIEAVRVMIPKLEIDPQCEYLIKCFLNYSKEWDDKLQTWKKTPLHDEYSHGADVLRSIAQNTIESMQHNSSRMSSSSSTSNSGSGYAL